MNFINIKMQNFFIIFESVEIKSHLTLLSTVHIEKSVSKCFYPKKLPDLPEIFILFRVMLLSFIPHIDAHVGRFVAILHEIKLPE